MPRAAIDIGSNSLLLTIADDDGRIVHDEARVVGLGRGLGDRGLFAPDRMQAATDTLTDYMNTARKHGVDPWSVKAVATSAARRSMNAQTFFSKVQRSIGLRVRIIEGDEEARLTWLGASTDLELPAGPRLVIDLGGGSTELVLGQESHVTLRSSVEIGSVRLTEQYLGTGVVDPAALARLRNHVDTALSGIDIEPAPRVVIGVAGSVTTLSATTLGLGQYDAAAVHASSLTRAQLAGFIDALLLAGPDERRAMVPVAPDRADYLLAACVILDKVLSLARRQQMVVSDRGLRFGLLAS